MDTFGLSDLYTILIGTVAAGVVFVAAPVLWRRLRAAIDVNPRRPIYHVVKSSQAAPAPAAANIMSRSALAPAVDGPSSLRQTADQTRQMAQTAPDRDINKQKMLDIYREMRAAGVTREKARPILKVMGMPLDNNLWAEAAPPDAPAPAEPRIIMVRDNGEPPRPVVFDAQYPYEAPPA